MNPEERITLGLLDNGTVRGEFAHDLFLLGASRRSLFSGVLHFRDSLLSRGRNTVMRRFVEGESDWLLMVDADQRISIDDFDRLVGVADSTERPVVSGLYFGIESHAQLYPRVLPIMYLCDPDNTGKFFPITHYEPDTVIKVDAVGAGMMLIHRSVPEAIRKTTEYWFLDHPLDDGSWLGEDMHFCNLIREAGFPIYVHTGAVSEHLKTYSIEEQHYIEWRDHLDRTEGDPEGYSPLI